MTQDEENLASGDRPSTAKARWTSPILVDPDGDLNDAENGASTSVDSAFNPSS